MTPLEKLILYAPIPLRLLLWVMDPDCHQQAQDQLQACRAACQDPVQYPTPGRVRVCLRGCSAAHRESLQRCKD